MPLIWLGLSPFYRSDVGLAYSLPRLLTRENHGVIMNQHLTLALDLVAGASSAGHLKSVGFRRLESLEPNPDGP
jgi:hypothetical protein